MRTVRVTYSNDQIITTDMAEGTSDDEILDYFAIGRWFNLGNAGDVMATVRRVEILK